LNIIGYVKKLLSYIWFEMESIVEIGFLIRDTVDSCKIKDMIGTKDRPENFQIVFIKRKLLVVG
jgi:hypothetical protein